MGGRVTFPVMRLFRRRFSDLVERQLDLFMGDHRAEIAGLVQALDEHHRSSQRGRPGGVRRLPGPRRLGRADLIALRDAYASTLDDDTAAAYRRAFSRGVRRRFPALARAVESEDVD